MQNESTETSISELVKSERVTFIFPRTPELALYALATLQSFADHYYRATERVRVSAAMPDSKRELFISVVCDQRFYLYFKESFPSCAEWIAPMYKPEVDEMTIVLTEERLLQFELYPMYSIQWLMGQLAGTPAQMLPKIIGLQRGLEPRDNLVSSVFMCLWQDNFKDQAVAIHAGREINSYESIGEFLMHAKLVVSEQNFVTVLAIAIGIPTVEITKTASQRPFLGFVHYIQVSRLQPETFFGDAIVRGIEWLRAKNTSKSIVQNVADTLAICQQV